MHDRPIVASLAHADERRIIVRVSDDEGARLLEYVGQGVTWPQPPPTWDFIAVALSHYAAAAGRDLVVEGPVSTSQLDRLAEFGDIWAGWLPDVFRAVRISAAEEVRDPAPGPRRGAVLGFSGGVDASFALAAHHDGLLGRRSRHIGTGVLVVGWDLKHHDDTARTVAQRAATESLSAYGVGTRVVATNWQQQFCPAWFKGYNVGLAALLQTFAGDHDAAVMAADHTYLDEFATGPIGMHMSVNHLLAPAHFPIVSTGGTHRRLDRLAYLANHPVLLANLRVCYQRNAAGGNCGRCEKCVRTQLEMRVCGIDPAPHFTRLMQPDDLRTVRITRPGQLIFLEDVVAELPADDPARPRLRALLRRERLRLARRTGNPLVPLVDDGRLQLAAARAEADAVRAELETMRASRAWRATEPVRALRSRIGSPASSAAG
jgi:hypothetical protein